MAAAGVVCEKKRRANLSDLAEVEKQRNRRRFDVEELLDGCDDAHEVGEVAACGVDISR